jgi:hypothetical protein
LLAQDPGTLQRVAGSLKRVFVGDSTFRADGLRRIWHRGENTTDVVSWVDREGRIMRQEFTFGGLVVRWERDRGVISGSEQGADEHSMPAVRTVEDWGANTELFEASFALLCAVAQSDFYLRHLMHQLAAHIGAEMPLDRDTLPGEVTLTNVLTKRGQNQQWGFEEVAEKEDHFALWLTVSALGTTLFVVALWYVLTH